METSDLLFRDLTNALGACLDYVEGQHELDLEYGDYEEPRCLVKGRPVYYKAIEILRPDLCPVCGFYKSIHPRKGCERSFGG